MLDRTPYDEDPVATPVALLMEDGTVLDAVEGKAAVGLVPDWVQSKLIRQ